MTPASEQPLIWSARRRWTTIAIAIIAQVVLIYWFSDRSPMIVRRAEIRPAIQLAARAHSEWLTLTTPTLFALPHPLGFSGRAWLTVPAHDYRPSEPANVPQWLALTPESLGASFREFVRTNRSARIAVAIRPPPTLADPSVKTTPIAATSRVQLDAALGQRGLRSQWKLPAWSNNKILLPSEVQVLVDASGHPISAVLLGSSGLPAADLHALELVHRAVFGPDQAALEQQPNDPAAGLLSGRLEFFWATLPPDGNGTADPR